MQNLQDTSKNTKDESCSGGTTSKMQTDKEQYSQNMVRQLRRWQRFCNASWQGWRTEWRTAQRTRCSQIIEITRSRLSRNMHQDSSTSMTKKLGRSCGFAWKEFARSPSGRPSLEKKFRGRAVQKQMENIPTWECLYVHRKLGLCLSVYIDDIKMVRKSRPSNPCEKFCQRD